LNHALITLVSDADSDVRKQAAQSLSDFPGDPRAIPALKRLLDDPNSDVRDAAKWTLKQLGEDPARTSKPANAK
jgi:HEAT repeat protein